MRAENHCKLLPQLHDHPLRSRWLHLRCCGPLPRLHLHWLPAVVSRRMLAVCAHQMKAAVEIFLFLFFFLR